MKPSRRELERRLEAIEQRRATGDPGPIGDTDERDVRGMLEDLTDEQDRQVSLLLEQLDLGADGETEEAIIGAIGGLLCGDTIGPDRLKELVDDDLLDTAG